MHRSCPVNFRVSVQVILSLDQNTRAFAQGVLEDMARGRRTGGQEEDREGMIIVYFAFQPISAEGAENKKNPQTSFS